MTDWGRGKVEGEERKRGSEEKSREEKGTRERGRGGRQGLEKGEKPVDLLRPCSLASEEISPFNTI